MKYEKCMQNNSEFTFNTHHVQILPLLIFTMFRLCNHLKFNILLLYTLVGSIKIVIWDQFILLNFKKDESNRILYSFSI